METKACDIVMHTNTHTKEARAENFAELVSSLPQTSMTQEKKQKPAPVRLKSLRED